MSVETSALLALLVAGHALGDFVFQTDWMIGRKRRPAGLLSHGAVVALCHVIALAPFLGRPALLAVGAIAVAHVLIDAIKAAVTARLRSHELECFFLDQLAHLGVIAAACLWLAPRARIVDPWFTPELLRTLGVVVAAYAFNVNGMSAVVAGLLSRHRIAPSQTGPSAGRLIGILERMFTLTLILLDRWDAVGLLLAAKSLARFKELDERQQAEYYLVGTLVSLLGATATALAVGALLRR